MTVRLLRLLSLAAVLANARAMNIGGTIRKALGVEQSAGQKACISDYMATNVVALEASSSLEEAAQVLVDKKIRGAPVVDGDGKLVGVLSQCASGIVTPHDTR